MSFSQSTFIYFSTYMFFSVCLSFILLIKIDWNCWIISFITSHHIERITHTNTIRAREPFWLSSLVTERFRYVARHLLVFGGDLSKSNSVSCRCHHIQASPRPPPTTTMTIFVKKTVKINIKVNYFNRLNQSYELRAVNYKKVDGCGVRVHWYVY